jgi:hypothetical protein
MNGFPPGENVSNWRIQWRCLNDTINFSVAIRRFRPSAILKLEGIAAKSRGTHSWAASTVDLALSDQAYPFSPNGNEKGNRAD